ncbi:DNA repair protein RadA/Sms [Streptomyces sp. Ncost-T6T-2b]|nr:DNA repair protein RadA/Sms [Streptomyces sp. Ncost-T6T-2b]
MKVTEVADMGDALRVLPRRSRQEAPQEDNARR